MIKLKNMDKIMKRTVIIIQATIMINFEPTA